MKTRLIAGFLGGMLLASAPLALHANANGSVTIVNRSKHAVWVTTYAAPDRRDKITRAQCYLPGQDGAQPSTSSTRGGWVLFELKASATSCKDHGNWKVFERNVVNIAYVSDSAVSAE